MKKPLFRQQQLVQEYVSKQKERVTDDAKKSRQDIQEIGCSLVRMGQKTVRIVEWHEKWESVVVEVDGEVQRYTYPLHQNIYRRFVDFEVLEDCGYLDKFANGTEYIVNGKRYGVKDDVVWAGGKRYLSSEERAKFGSFEKFLAGKDFFSKKTII